MSKEGKHVYCIIKCDGECTLPITELGERVHTINHADLAAVVSELAPPNIRAHKLMIEEVLKYSTVLPVRFAHSAKTTDQIKRILDEKFNGLHRLLWQMDNKVELGLKAWWKASPMSPGFIGQYYPKIRDWRQRLMDGEPSKGVRRANWIQAFLELKDRSMNAVDDLRRRETARILTALDPLAANKRIKAATRMKMIVNVAFLVDRNREEEFASAVKGLAERYGSEIEFIPTGPLPPYSFVDLVI